MAENSRKSFRKSVSDVTKKIFSKNKSDKRSSKNLSFADENFEKQKKELIDGLKKFQEDRKLNEILKNNPKSDNVKKFRASLSLKNGENIDKVVKRVSKSKSSDDLEKLNIALEKANEVAGDVKKYSDKIIYRLNSIIAKKYINEIEKNRVKAAEIKKEYMEKINSCNKDSKLENLYGGDGINFLIDNMLVAQKRTLENLASGVEGEINFNCLKSDLEKMVFGFPNSLFDGKDFKIIKDKFDKRYSELQAPKLKNGKILSVGRNSNINIGTHRKNIDLSIKTIENDLKNKEKIVESLWKKGVVGKSQKQRTLLGIRKQKAILSKIESKKSEGKVANLVKQFDLSQKNIAKDLEDERKVVSKIGDKQAEKEIKEIQDADELTKMISDFIDNHF